MSSHLCALDTTCLQLHSNCYKHAPCVQVSLFIEVAVSLDNGIGMHAMLQRARNELQIPIHLSVLTGALDVLRNEQNLQDPQQRGYRQ